MTYEEVYTAAQKRLTEAEVLGAARELRKLLCKVIGSDDGIIRIDMRENMPSDQQEQFEALVVRRIAHEPVSHLLQKREFYGRDFEVSRDVLDPRQDTETLIDAALEFPFDRVLDLGTGSGCIVLTLVAEARLRFQSLTWGCGTDISEDALNVARRNQERHGMQGPVLLRRGVWFAPVLEAGIGPFDLIVSNPPYIAADEMNTLQPEVRLHEPRIALTDEADGLTAYRNIVAGAPAHLTKGGRLIVEIGPTQATPVCKMMENAGFDRVTVTPDLDGRDRVVSGYWPEDRPQPSA